MHLHPLEIFRIVFLKQWSSSIDFAHCMFLFWLDPSLSISQVDQLPAALILRLAHQNRLENRQPDLLKYLLVGTWGLNRWEDGDWDEMVGDAVCFVVFAWQHAAEFFIPWGMVWWRIIFRFHAVWWRTFRVVLEELFVLRKGLVLSPLQLGNGDFPHTNSTQTDKVSFQRWNNPMGMVATFILFPMHVAVAPALSPGTSWYGLWGFGQRFTGQGPKGAWAYHGECWVKIDSSGPSPYLFRWNSMRQAPMQVR